MSKSTRYLFGLGQIVATPAHCSIGKLDKPGEFLERHHSGDWGNLDEHDRQETPEVLSMGFVS